jgi:large subunit ribosomal protein L23
MSSDNLARILVSPIVSEKSTRLGDTANQSVFKVLKNSTKPEIKKAVEKMFNVKVLRVTTTSVPGKSRRRGRYIGKTQSWKKAYITLAKGQDINYLVGE